MARKTDVEKAILAFSKNTSFFPPGRQALAELSQELDIEVIVLQEVVAQLTMGLLDFVEVKETPETKPEIRKPQGKNNV